MAIAALIFSCLVSSVFADFPITIVAKRQPSPSVCSAYPISAATKCLSSSASSTSAFIDAACGPFGPTTTVVNEVTETVLPTTTLITTTYLETVYSPTATTNLNVTETSLSTTCITETLTVTSNRTSTSFVADATVTSVHTSTDFTCPGTLLRIPAITPAPPAYQKRATATISLGSCLESVSANYGAQALITACDCVQTGRAGITVSREDTITETASGSTVTTVTEISTSTVTTRTIHGVMTSTDVVTTTKLVTSIETLKTTVPIIVSATRTHTVVSTSVVTEPEPTNFESFRLTLSDPSVENSNRIYGAHIPLGGGIELAFPSNTTTGDTFRINTANELIDTDYSLNSIATVLTDPTPQIDPILYFQQPDPALGNSTVKVDFCNGKLRALGGVFALCPRRGRRVLAWGPESVFGSGQGFNSTGSGCTITDVWVAPSSNSS